MKSSILLIAVCYRSYDALHRFLQTVDKAAYQAADNTIVDIAIADNTDIERQIIDLQPYSSIRQFFLQTDKGNIGYLGGALPLYNQYGGDYDYVGIANVDLQLQPDFFLQLATQDQSDAGWIAPDIYTPQNLHHENPFMLQRPEKRHFIRWNIIYSNTLIFRLYHLLHRIKGRHTSAISQTMPIYAGHGSFMLFTRAFVQTYPTLHFPAFMYGEEIFLAELVRQARLKTYYIPNLHITNTGSISTGTLPQHIKSQWSKQSLKAIYQLFFTKKITD